MASRLNAHRLVRCERDGFPAAADAQLSEALAEMCGMTATLYERLGFELPWVSYLAMVDGAYVGGGAFVGAPKDGQVEIAYFTLSAFEGQGYASETARKLVSLARTTDPAVALTAKTMPQENASTAILRRLGFERVGTAIDHEIGEAWLWTLK